MRPNRLVATSLAAAAIILGAATAISALTTRSVASPTPTQNLALLSRPAAPGDAIPVIPANVTRRLALLGLTGAPSRLIGSVDGTTRWLVAGTDAACVISTPANNAVVSVEWGCSNGPSVGTRGGLVDLERHGQHGALLQVVALQGFDKVTLGSTSFALRSGSFFASIPASSATPVATLTGPAGTVTTPLPPLDQGPVPPFKK